MATAAFVATGCESTPTTLDGTYVLDHRVLPDGQVQRPPEIVGLLTYADGYRNFNIVWPNPDGTRTAIGSIARYALTGDVYTEESVYYTRDDGAGATYDLSGPRGSSPVTRRGDEIEFELPLFDEPMAVFTPGGFHASVPGVFTDYWTRVD
ncbi:MAG: hypothetical protein HKO59_12725 [Phycisphaerales bacterium]|nr:hypothetical protein [Phycisphaerales bacterium]NNM26827.1 hypothetical protein [Phycisphaerales bacterium]